jgi:hypothetical protein
MRKCKKNENCGAEEEENDEESKWLIPCSKNIIVSLRDK